MTPAELAARLAAQGLAPTTWHNEPGDTYAAHQHDYDKVLVAASGSITFHLVESGADVNLSAGQRLDLPAATVHAATVGAAGVTCFEAHVRAGTLGATPRHRAAADW